MDTNAMLLPVLNAKTSHDGLVDVIKANTAAFKEIRGDLGQCNSQERVQAIIYKVEDALTDLSITSQKIPKWVKDGDDPAIPPHYGQYPVNMPLNPNNPVPWPPGYMPPPSTGQSGEIEGPDMVKNAQPDVAKRSSMPPWEEVSPVEDVSPSSRSPAADVKKKK